jgi:hypothetical protein
VSISLDGSFRNFTLGQEGTSWVVRLRTTRTGANGTSPELRVPGLMPRLTHVVVTYDGRTERIYLDGRQARESTKVAGSLSGWETQKFALVLGNEFNDRRDWAGTIKFVAFYARALSAEEVVRAHHSPPPGSRASGSRKPSADDVF